MSTTSPENSRLFYHQIVFDEKKHITDKLTRPVKLVQIGQKTYGNSDS